MALTGNWLVQQNSSVKGIVMSGLSVEQESALKEFESLRNEILGRIVLRDQMVNYASGMIGGAVALAAFVSHDTQAGATSIILFAYPFTAFAFAYGWATHDVRIWEIAQYINSYLASPEDGKDLSDGRENWPPRLPLYWEAYLNKQHKLLAEKSWVQSVLWRRRQTVFAVFFFAGSATISTLLALMVSMWLYDAGDKTARQNPLAMWQAWCLFGFDIFIIIMMIAILAQRSMLMEPDSFFARLWKRLQGFNNDEPPDAGQ